MRQRHLVSSPDLQYLALWWMQQKYLRSVRLRHTWNWCRDRFRGGLLHYRDNPALHAQRVIVGFVSHHAPKVDQAVPTPFLS